MADELGEDALVALEIQAQELAEKALPRSLPTATRAAKLLTVKHKILERLRLQVASGVAASTAGIPACSPGKGAPVAPELSGVTLPPPTPDERLLQLKVEGAELCGDEAWFADHTLRARLRATIAEAHSEQKILVGFPREEIQRICPEGRQPLGAGAILRLGGSHLGGYGEADIAYTYRQLSRALHPDKNPDIPQAQEAFHRLREAADELRQDLQEQRRLVARLAAATGQQATDDVLERPQEALLAEACRLLAVVCGLAGEGEVPTLARSRALAAFSKSVSSQAYRAPELLCLWFERPQLIDALASSSMRAAYDCAPKRYRAQFLCFLGRVLFAEARRAAGSMPRDIWNQLSVKFPELSLWQELRDQLLKRCWQHEGQDGELAGRSRSRSPRLKRSRWARKWRVAIRAVLPSGEDGAVAATDAEVRKLSHVLWKDVATWVAETEGGAESNRALGLFKADNQSSATFGWAAKDPQFGEHAPPAEWCFIPTSDLLLIVGEGLVGITSEGIFADNPQGHRRLSLAECYRKKSCPVGIENAKAHETAEAVEKDIPKATTLSDLLGMK
eukprot:TRINITY_DN76612_c0_g1_i1.p1 TRINITY_DN76612_c0_g1~~TRINITY_DN76612_c0_g1_i1.p1  ORF type:complete len:563 (-),score=113.66 TRINITY_DN76612_c0_g1_i1:105-1793(-)